MSESASPAERPPRAAPSRRKDLLSALLQLSALSGFALAQPGLDALKRDAAFFVARRSETADIILFAAGIAILPPVMLFVLELLAEAIHRRARVALHFAFVTALLSAVVLPPLKRSVELGPESMLGLAGALGLLLALACTRLETVKTFLSILSPVPLVAAALFLLHPPIAKLLRPDDVGEMALAQIDSDTNVVFLVLDELPVTSLMNSKEEISRKLFPNFARLAANSTWFRNATASHVQTAWAVPSLMTGMRPSDTDLMPIAADHPRSLFTLLARSHRIRAIEASTQLCPEHLLDNAPKADATLGERMASLQSDFSIFYAHMVLPRQLARSLPSVTETWGDFAVRAAERGPGTRTRTWPRRGAPLEFFDEFIGLIDESDEPTLYALHVNAPHSPWEYTENGLTHISPETARRQFPGQTNGVWHDDVAPTNLALQHHLLQLGNLDRYLGRLIDRLEEAGAYDQSVIVLTADHGVSFRPGHHRRKVTGENLGDLMNVPLFVKLPFQEDARIDDRNVESIDALPTIVDALGCELPWEVDGTSALGSGGPERETKSFFNVKDELFTLDGRRPPRSDVVDRKEALFGADPTWDDVYAMGDSAGLVGRSIDELGAKLSVVARGVIDEPWRLASVAPETGFVPGTIKGDIFARAHLVPKRLAIAINGTVRAVSRTFGKNRSTAHFAVTVPAYSFVPGWNSCEVYVIDKHGDLMKLVQMAPFKLQRERNGEERIICHDGGPYRIRAGASGGVVTAVTTRKGKTWLVGWAGDVVENRAAESVLFFQGSSGISLGGTGVLRPELRKRHRAKAKVHRSGFHVMISEGTFGEPLDGSLRAFGVIGNVASELRFGGQARWAWVRQP